MTTTIGVLYECAAALREHGVNAVARHSQGEVDAILIYPAGRSGGGDDDYSRAAHVIFDTGATAFSHDSAGGRGAARRILRIMWDTL